MNAILQSLPQLFTGFATTLTIFACAAGLGLLGGIALLISRTFGPKPLVLIVKGYTNFFRSVPLVIILLFYFLALPDFFNKTFTAILAFAFFESAYFCEILRSGLSSIKRGQLEAALSLGLTKRQAFQYVLLPQALKASREGLRTQSIVLFQDTSLVYIIGVNDFFTIANRSGQNTGDITSLILFAGLVYLAIGIGAQRITTRKKAAL